MNSPDDDATLPPTIASEGNDPTQVEEAAAVRGYMIERELGRGGMGVVYKARQAALNRTVALKMILSGEHAGAADLARFRSEAEAIARLQHPNIVQIHEVGEQGGVPYFSLEFCSGGSLDQTLNGTPLPAQQAATLVEALARAMQAAHEKGVIHRDLKPANVLLTEDNTPKITDFGLAKKLDEAGKTATGAIMGTPSYMPPEQAASSKDLGPACDIYALGAILYECLTGRPPFRASTPMDTLLQVLSDDPVTPRSLNAQVPRDLETICLKCLHKEPAKRYPRALDLAEDLRRFGANEPITARPVGRTERALRWMRRNPVGAGALALGSLLLAAAVAVPLFVARQEALHARVLADEKQAAEDARQQADEARGLAELREKEARWSVYTGRLFMMNEAWRERDFGRLEQLLAETTPAAGAPDFRGWEWYYFQDQCKQASWRLEGTAPANGDAEVCRKTGRIAVATIAPFLEVWDRAGQKVVLRSPRLAGPPHRPVWSPDGTRIACYADRALMVWHLDTGTVVDQDIKKAGIRSDWPWLIAWHPDNRRLALATPATIHLWDTECRALERQIDARSLVSTDTRVYALDWHPDGKRLAVGLGSGKLAVWDTRTGTFGPLRSGSGGRVTSLCWDPTGQRLAVGADPVRIYSEAEEAPQTIDLGVDPRLAWNPDGTLLVSGSQDQVIRVAEVARGHIIRSLRVHSAPIWTVGWGPDGRTILHTSEGVVRLSDSVRPDQKAATTSFGAKTLGDIAWSPNGKWLAVRAGKLTLLDPRTGQSERDVPSDAGLISIAWSGDGNRLLTMTNTGKVRIWEADTGRQLRAFTARVNQYGENTGVSWSLDGRWLVTTNAIQKPHCVLWDAADGRPLSVSDPDSKYNSGRSVVYSPDGTRLAHTVRPFLLLQAPDLREVVSTGDGGTMGWTRHVWSPDGRIVVSNSNTDSDLIYVRASDGVLIHRARGHRNRLGCPAWSPDGRRVATCSLDGTVKIWDAATGTHLVTLSDGTSPIYAVAWSPDGRRLATSSEDGVVRFWGSPDILGAEPTATHLETGVIARARAAAPAPADSTPPPEPSPATSAARNLVLAELLDRTGHHGEAAQKLDSIDAQLEVLAARQPDDPTVAELHDRAAAVRAMLHLRAGRHEQAMKAYQVLAARQPREPTHHLQLGRALTNLGKEAEAVKAFTQAAAAWGDNVSRLNHHAWELATHADPKLRSGPGAVILASKATRLQPSDGTHWKTLGAAHHRAGSWQAAHSALEQSLKSRRADLVDWFLLAMCHHHLGERDKGRQYFNRAADWIHRSQSATDKVTLFHAEAAKVLGIEEDGR